MTSATLTHQPMPARKAAQDVTQAATPTAEATERDQAAQTAHETRLLATITGVATLVILVFFLSMMWILSSYGPSV